MSKSRISILFIILSALFAVSAFGQYAPSAIVKKELSQAEINRITTNFTKKEAEFREALKGYIFNRYATIQTLGFGGQITGEYRRDSFMTFKETGERFEKILFAPVSTLDGLTITPEDIDDLGGINPFALEPSVISLYNITYLGKEKIDELDLYVFDVAPKVMPDPKKSKQRVFTGRIWVDDQDLQIVKTRGKAGPEWKNNKFPVVETWRENIDGKFWFPAYSSANDELVFDNGSVVRLKMRVKYTDYKQGRSEVKIIDDGVIDETPEAKPTPTPKPSPLPTPKASPTPTPVPKPETSAAPKVVVSDPVMATSKPTPKTTPTPAKKPVTKKKTR